MRTVIQRVSDASVSIDNSVVGKINRGLVILAGFGKDDDEKDLQIIAEKIINLRIFEDSSNKFNLSVKDIGGELLVIPNFTLYGDARKGRRPDFTAAASIDDARKFYDKFLEIIGGAKLNIVGGQFQAHMNVSINNDGPVTLLLDSKRAF